MVSFSEDSIRAIRGPGGVNLEALKKAVAVSDASISLRTLSSRGNLQASLTYPHRHDRLGQVASKQPLCPGHLCTSKQRSLVYSDSSLTAHDGSMSGAHRKWECWQNLIKRSEMGSSTDATLPQKGAEPRQLMGVLGL